MAGDALGHVLVARLGGGDEDNPGVGREPCAREAALAAARASDDEERWSHLPGSSLEDRRTDRARAGLLALGSSYSPRLPGLTGQWHSRVSSPITVTGSRRLQPPSLGPRGHPRARTTRETVAEGPVDRNTCHRADDRLPPQKLTLRRTGADIGQHTASIP